MTGAHIEIHEGDITRLEVDAIVNAANTLLAPGGGVCGAIHRAAGLKLAAACLKLGGSPTGEARITDGFKLPARYVIHTVGPVWRGGDAGEAELLGGCYRHCLRLAAERGIESIAFPAISTGIYGYPLSDACAIAVATVRRELKAATSVERVILCTFGADVTSAYRRALEAVQID